MKICFQHPNQLPVKKYGGTERILYWHMKELVRQGHKVSFIGPKNCQLDDSGIEHIPFDGPTGWEELIPKDSDIFHLQYNYSPKIKIPVIYTLHGNAQIGELLEKNTVFVSKSHADNHNAKAFVHNALDLTEYPYLKKNKVDLGDYFESFLFLAKASWSVKNLKDCIKVCKKNEKDLYIAGGKSFQFSRYIHNHGLVDQNKKMELLRTVDALLFPVRWHEPFGIAIIEAMSQGLPVIGSPYGSLPELITKNVGIICKNFSELHDAINSDKTIFNPNAIREYVEENFSIELYTQRFLKFYQKVIDGETLHKEKPSWQNELAPQDLLPY